MNCISKFLYVVNAQSVRNKVVDANFVFLKRQLVSDLVGKLGIAIANGSNRPRRRAHACQMGDYVVSLQGAKHQTF